MAPTAEARVESHSAVILLPTLNEEEGLERTYAELPLDHLNRSGFHTRVLVVDGGSTDGTVDVARRLGLPVLRQVGRGKGNAVRQGLAAAIEQGDELVAILDADYSYVAESLLPAFSLLAAGTDLVVGARRPFHDPSESLRTVVHRVADALLSLTAARMSGVPFLDICSGLWGVRTDAVRRVRLESEGFEIEAELFLKMAREGLRVSQVPVTYRPRVGDAKLHAVRDGSRILLTILRHSRALRHNGSSADLRYWPGEPPGPGARPSREWLRMVQALCFSVSPPHLSIVADPGREEEARELARRLWTGEIDVSVTVSVAAARGPPPVEPDGGEAAPTVRLPALLDGAHPVEVAVVRVPHSRSEFRVRAGSDPWLEDLPLSRSGGRRLLGRHDGASSFLGNLAAAINGSPEARSEALLHAAAGSFAVRTEAPRADAVGPIARMGIAGRLSLARNRR